MDIVCLLFDGITALDIVGPYEVLQRLPEANVKFVARRRRARCAPTTGSSRSSPTTRSRDVTSADVLVVPGGFATRALESDTSVARVDPRRSTRPRTWTTSVCTGSMLLGGRGTARGQGSDDALGVARPLAGLRRDPDRAASRRAGQDHHRGRRVVGHRHGASRSPPASRATSTRRAMQLGDRVRPAAAVRLRIAGEGARARRRVHAGAVRRARLVAFRQPPSPLRRCAERHDEGDGSRRSRRHHVRVRLHLIRRA